MINFWTSSIASVTVSLHTKYTNNLLCGWAVGMTNYWTGSVASVTVKLHTEYTNTLCFAVGRGYDYITEPVHSLHKQLVYTEYTNNICFTAGVVGLTNYWTGSVASIRVSLRTECASTLCFVGVEMVLLTTRDVKTVFFPKPVNVCLKPV